VAVVAGLAGRIAAGAFAVGALILLAPPSAAAGTPPHRGTAAGCTAAALRAVRLRVTLHSLPAACRGLRPVEVQRAAITAIDDVSVQGDKVQRRRQAAIAGARLGFLIGLGRPTPPAHLSSARPVESATPAVGRVISVGLAALVAWLLTATTGGYLLAGWLAHGGMRRARTASAGLPPAVILSHFGLAATGLIGWIGYLVSGSGAVAWISAGMLLPVVGLGIGTLLLAIPEVGSLPAQRSRPPVIVISAHGICATATLLLVLLAAIAAR
jgi:manganese efflux pump family protein